MNKVNKAFSSVLVLLFVESIGLAFIYGTFAEAIIDRVACHVSSIMAVAKCT